MTLTDRIIETLGDHIDEFDIDAIAEEICNDYDTEDIDDVPAEDYNEILQRHSTTEDRPAQGEVVEREFYFVIQRTHIDSYDQLSWVDTSGKYWGSGDGDTAKVATLAERDRLREIFGEGSVRVVRRDVVVTETLVK